MSRPKIRKKHEKKGYNKVGSSDSNCEPVKIFLKKGKIKVFYWVMASGHFIGLNGNPHFGSILCRTQSAKKQLNSHIPIPNHVRDSICCIKFSSVTLCHERPQNISFLILPKNPSQAELSGEHPLLYMDLVSPAASTRLIRASHR